MRQSFRALGWTINIAVMLFVAFLGLSGYSMIETLMTGRNMGLSEPELGFYDGVASISFSFFINNTGYFDFSDANLTTVIRDANGTLISSSTSVIQRIPRGSRGEKTHSVSISLADMLSKNMSYLLFEDANLLMEISLGFRYAYAYSFQELTNMSLFWGAPIYNLTVKSPAYSFNGTSYLLCFPLSFENHSFFDVNGTLHLEAYSDEKKLLGTGTKHVHAPSRSAYGDRVEVVVKDPAELTPTGEVRILFETPVFTFERVMHYG